VVLLMFKVLLLHWNLGIQDIRGGDMVLSAGSGAYLGGDVSVSAENSQWWKCLDIIFW